MDQASQGNWLAAVIVVGSITFLIGLWQGKGNVERSQSQLFLEASSHWPKVCDDALKEAVDALNFRAEMMEGQERD